MAHQLHQPNGMMTLLRKRCPEDAPELIESYLLDRLSVTANSEIEDHLIDCSRCIKVFHRIEQIMVEAHRERILS